MAELTFAKSFLSMLESRPVKRPLDHVIDPQTMWSRGSYTLPRMPFTPPSLPKKTKLSSVPGMSKSVNICLKSARNPVLELSIKNAPLSTITVQDMKNTVRERVVDSEGEKIALDKIKILYKRKPVSGNTIASFLSDEPALLDGGEKVEFGVMIMGGATVINPQLAAAAIASGAESVLTTPLNAENILATDSFWGDLEDFLEQQLKDRTEAGRLTILFRDAWRAQR